VYNLALVEEEDQAKVEAWFEKREYVAVIQARV
jgi:hypothetical protein